ncbi:MAG: alginate lyase family protein [Parvularculaceae bacterium]
MPHLVLLLSALATLARADVGAPLDRSGPVTRAIENRLRSVDDFLLNAPERADRLFAALDLERPALREVKAALARNDENAAATALLAHYRKVENAAWLRTGGPVHDPGGYDDHRTMAVAALRDAHTFQSVTGVLKRTPEGRIDWQDRGPRADLQWALFNNRHFGLLPLLKSYADDGDPVYAALADATIQDWALTNYPPPEAKSDKLLPASWRPMTKASRLLQVWPQVFYGLRDEPAFSDAGRLTLLSSVPEQMGHLMRYHRTKHNHAVKEMAGLAHAAASFPEFADAPAWRARAIEVLSDEIDRQLYPTGVQKELTAHYQRTVLEYLLQYVEFMRAASDRPPQRIEKRIEDMGTYLVEAMRPSGAVPLTNDSDLDNVRELALRLADIFDRPDWAYIATHGARGVRPDGPASRFFPYGGQFVSRTDFGPTAEWLLFDAGPWGVSHQHQDKLHVSISRGDQDLVVDTGRFRYKNDDPLRRYVVQSSGHNVVFIDGAGQGPRALEASEPMREAAFVSEALRLAVGSYADGFAGVDGLALHRRAVLHLSDVGVLVVDDVETDRPRSVRAQWHLHPDLAPEMRGGVIDAATEKAAIRLTPVGVDGWRGRIARGERDPWLGWYSPYYNEISPAPLAIYETTIAGSALFAWFFQTTPGAAPPPRIELTRAPAPDGVFRARIIVAGETIDVAVRLRGDRPIALDGGRRLNAAAMVERDGEITVVGGALLNAAGEVLQQTDWTY